MALADVLGLSLDRWLPACDLFHATDHLLPPLRRIPTVFTVHDLAFLVHPDTHLPSNRVFLQLMVPRFLRRATAIIADSEATRRDVLRYYAPPPEKVHVVHLGVEPAFQPVDPDAARAVVARQYALTPPYLLFVGTLEPRKNLRGLLIAYRRLLSELGPALPPLIVAGAPGWWHEESYRAVERLGLTQHVRFVGRVAERDLPALYGAATAFLYPSLYEGFGLPPLEALACGTAVICSNRASLPEVVGDAAVQVDPINIAELATALRRVLSDANLRAELRARGLARAAQFTWARTASATVDVYRQVLATSRAR